MVLIRARDDVGAQQRLRGLLARLYDEPPAAARARARGARRPARAGPRPVGARPPLAARLGRADRPLRRVDLLRAAARARRARSTCGASSGCSSWRARSPPAGTLRRLVHVSTAYVSGRHAGEFGEQDLDVGQEFRNTYERSKHEAERLLRGADDLPLAVARPSIVVGHSASGWTSAFNVLYWPMRAFERGLLDGGARARGLDRRLRARRLRHRRHPRAARRRGGVAAPTTSSPARTRSAPASSSQLHSAVTGREPVRFVAQGRRRRERRGCRPAPRRSCRTSTCAAASATSARVSCSARAGVEQARPAGLPRAADRVRAPGALGQAGDHAAGVVRLRARPVGTQFLSRDLLSRELCITIVIQNS